MSGRYKVLLVGTLLLTAIASAVTCIGGGRLAVRAAMASSYFAAQDPSESEVGSLGPLIPFHKDAIHAGLVWDGVKPPKIVFWMRPSEYRGTDMVDPTIGLLGEMRPNFERLVYGDFRFSTVLDHSVRTRNKPDISLENTLCFDLGHPNAFRNLGKYRVEELTAEDCALNAAAFTDAGSSRGLNYNIFCAGHAVLADGRWCVVGGHDKGGNNGIRKIILLDPETLTWTPRAMPLVKANFLADPTGDRIAGANPLNELHTDPLDPSDMKYQRWYPSSVTLPDGRVLILSGTDQDTSVGSRNASATKVRQAVPEVYDPATDRCTALENARKLFAMYPFAFVVQTGLGWDDWKVAVMTEVQPPLPTDLRPYDPWSYNGNTSFLDVRAALADTARDEPGEKHWELVATAQHPHESGAAVGLTELNQAGRARSQKAIVFGGSGSEGETAMVEMIDFEDRHPRWERQADLLQPATQMIPVALPDGNVLIVGGRANGLGARGEHDHSTLVANYRYQMFDPSTGKIQPLVGTTVPLWDHSTALVLPDASVIVMGGNRTDLVLGKPDAGVPVAQVYKPAYLFTGARPVITAAPEEMAYGSRFQVKVAPGSGEVVSVVLIRMEPVTHNWSWGNRYVKLDVKQGFADEGQTLTVQAPAVPGLAVPGYYMLFAVNERGVPSVARRVHLSLPR